MALKQKKLFIIASLIIVAFSVSLFTTQGDVKAYKCSDPSDPTAVWEYHDDGKCWKVRYQKVVTAPTSKYVNGKTEYSCSNGATLSDSGSGKECVLWKKNGYTSQDTGKILPTKNDGAVVTKWKCNESKATFIEDGPKGPGCYGVRPDGTVTSNKDMVWGNCTPGDPNNCVETPASVGGIMPEGNDSTQGSDSKAGCEASKRIWIVDERKCLDTREACESRGGTWDSSAEKEENLCKGGTKPPGSTPPDDPNNKTAQQPSGSYKGAQTQNCGKAQTNILSCDKDSSGSEVIGYILKAILMIMSVGVGILAVGGIVYGAILYSSAQDNAAQTKKAIEVIINTVIGLLLYIFMYSILNWLVPEGVFL